MTDPPGPADAGPDGNAPEPTPTPTPAAAPTPDDLTEVVVESEIIRRGRYLTFRIDTIERPDGSRAKREVVGHPGAVAILAIDDEDNVLMVRQFRVPAGRLLLEVPAGTLDIDTETGKIEDHALAAKRELEEETGYRAGTWRLLTSFWTAPGFATELMHLYLATELTPADDDRLGPDEDERLLLERIPFADAVALAERGEIVDAKSLVALLWLDRLTLRGPDGDGAAAAPEPATPPDEDAVSYQPRVGEILQASMAAFRRSRGVQAIGIVGGAAAVLGAANGDTIPAIISGFLAVIMLSGALAIPFVGYVVTRRRDLVLARSEFRASSAGTTYRSTAGQSSLPWATFTRIRETSQFFLLETGMSTVYVPKRAFEPDALTHFRRLIADAGFGPDGRRRR